MENNSKILSICVLSYNQADEIKRLLDSVCPQITDEVEIFIRDDSTNFETETLVKEYKKKYPIRYFHGNKEGIDRTVIYFVKEAVGKYVWWVGDDIIREGSILKLLNILKQHTDIDFVWANYNIAGHKKIAIDFPEDRFFKNTEELLVNAIGGMGFISATIFKREKALTGVPGAERYVGSLFSNLYLVLYVLSQRGKSYFFRGPLVTCYPTTPEEIKVMVNKNGEIKNRGFEVYGIHFYNIFNEFRGKFQSNAIRKVIKKNFSSLLRGMFVGWIGEWDNPPRIYLLEMLKRYWSFSEFWFAFPFLLMPLWVNKIFYKIYKVFFKNKTK